MKKIVINLQKGFKFKITETADTLKIDILRENAQTVKSKSLKDVVHHVASRAASTGKFVGTKEAAKRTRVKAPKRSGTGGTGPRKKK